MEGITDEDASYGTLVRCCMHPHSGQGEGGEKMAGVSAIQSERNDDFGDPSVSVILLNYNGWQDTVACLESVFGCGYSNYSVVIVDNGSTDSSLRELEGYCESHLVRKIIKKCEFIHEPLAEFERSSMNISRMEESSWESPDSRTPLTIIACPTNGGYAAGNNIGLRFAMDSQMPDYFLILNNDTLVGKGFLKEMVEVGEIDGEFGALGPRIHDCNNQERIAIVRKSDFDLWTGGFELFSSTTRESVPSSFGAVGWLSGCCLLVKNDSLRRVGFLDERYFLYGEDTDWCIRMRRAGLKLIYVPSATICHRAATSRTRPMSYYYFARNLFLLEKKFARGHQLFFFVCFFLLARIWIHLGVIAIYKRNGYLVLSFLRGVADGLNTALGRR